MEVQENLGAVASFTLPDDWVLDEMPPMGGRTIRVYRSPQNERVIFCDSFREILSRNASATFQKTLYAPFHELKTAEIQDLEEILEGVSNNAVFKIDTATTGYLNNHRAIRIAGNWTEENSIAIALFFDVGGSGQQVQNLFFKAPSSLFETLDLAKFAEKTFLSIKWRI